VLSFVIPCRNEYPQIAWTVYSLIEDVPDGEDFEIILVENGSDEANLKFLNYINKQRMGRKHLRIVQSEVGSWKARTKGVKEAKGDIIVFADAHIAVQRNSLSLMFNLLQKQKGIVYSPQLWMMDYKHGHGKLHQYKDPIRRGWSWVKHKNEPYTIACSSVALCMFKKDEWERFNGINPHLTLVGGGEQYLSLKWWLFGSQCWVHPDALYYHWTYERSWHKTGQGWNDHHLFNTLVFLWCLGGDVWVQKIYGDEINHSKRWLNFYLKVQRLCVDSRKKIIENQVYDGLTELFKVEPWDYPKKEIHKGITSY